jgi:hypothetical protein
MAAHSPARDDELREHIHGQVDRLAGADLDVLSDFLDAITTAIEIQPGAPGWLTRGWFDAFTARLRAHHALSIDPLSTKQFEDAFNASCRRQGWPTDPAESATHRFFDTAVVGPDSVPRTISLKASSAKDMRADAVHISKLTEAAWIQDERTQAGRRSRLVELFEQYRKATTSIIILRGFREPNGGVLYELVEIPTELFAAVDQLSVAQAQAATIPVPPEKPSPDFKIRIDRSDSKITLSGIRLVVCTVHARWTLPPSADAGTTGAQPACR